jgi:hypothetical protein
MRLDLKRLRERLRSLVPLGEQTADAPPDRRELRRRALETERRIDRAQERIGEHQNRYREELQAGAMTDSPSERRVHAITARTEKFKLRIQEIERMQALKDFTQLTFAMESQTIDSMVADMGSSQLTSAALEESGELQEMIDELVVGLKTDLGEMDEFMSIVDMDVSGIGIQATEEEAIMDRLAAEEIDLDDLQLDLEVETVAETPELDRLQDSISG